MATVNGNKVDLNWVTQTENNNDYFTVEKSRDAFSFEEVAIVKGGENNHLVQNYTISDLNPWNGISYYRLKQTNNDGEFVYLDIEAVDMEKLIDFDFSIYPNPLLSNQLHLYLNDLPKQEILLFITDLSGKITYSKTIFAENNGEYVVDLADKLTAGMYSVFLQIQTELYTRKLLVLPAE